MIFNMQAAGGGGGGMTVAQSSASASGSSSISFSVSGEAKMFTIRCTSLQMMGNYTLVDSIVGYYDNGAWTFKISMYAANNGRITSGSSSDIYSYTVTSSTLAVRMSGSTMFFGAFELTYAY